MKLTYYTGDGIELRPVEASLYGKNDVVRQMTRASIRRFVNLNAELLVGQVLDYGCGKPGTCAIPQPYRSLLREGVGYTGYEPGDACDWKDGTFNAILCTQVLQSVDDPQHLMNCFAKWLKTGGYLVLTAPGAWEEIETEKWRFTLHGLWALAHNAGLNVTVKQTLCSVSLDGALTLSIVNGMLARKGTAWRA